jgi:predicted RNA-binding Zn ribbon-like protein
VVLPETLEDDVETTERWPRLVGGNPALDFVNTDLFSQSDRATDVLRSVDEFLAWCAFAGVTSGSPGGGAQDRAFLREAADIRGSIRNVTTSLTSGLGPAPADLAALRSAYADALKRATPTLDGGGLAWRWHPSPHGALDELVSDAVDLLAGAPGERLKACPNCGHLFLDTTKNGGRRWCSMDDCGKQEKMRRYVTKRAETRAHAEA